MIDALEEAHRKVRGIEDAAQGLHSRELKTRLDRICQQARDHPGPARAGPEEPVPRAALSRHLSRRHPRRGHAICGAAARSRPRPPLAENFRRVLTTVEQVFAEQEEVLKQDDKLDLEVQIEVLETQLKREGVH